MQCYLATWIHSTVRIQVRLDYSQRNDKFRSRIFRYLDISMFYLLYYIIDIFKSISFQLSVFFYFDNMF